MGVIDLASSKSIWRGLEYYQKNKVISFEENDDGTYEGLVAGSGREDYHVHLDLTHPRKSTCDCPLASGKRIICKHIVAVSFCAKPSEADRFKNEKTVYASEEEEARARKYDRYMKMAERMSVKELREVFTEVMIESDNIRSKELYGKKNLLEEFDDSQNAVIDPDMVTEKIDGFPKVTISCFSKKLFNSVLKTFEPVKIAEIHSAMVRNPVYEVEYKGKKFALFQSLVGEPLCVSQYEDLIAMGSKRLILLGNCGVLDKKIEDCGIIIPTSALRDEGTSFHYAAPDELIKVNRKYRDTFKEVLADCGYPYIEGMTWTTDACYRETRKKVNRRRKQGAICVEMECAGMQALCDFRNTDFFQFFYAGDNLDHSSWEPRSISGETRLDDKTKIMFLAFELGLRILEKEKDPGQE